MAKQPRKPGPEELLRAEHMLALCRECLVEFADVEEQNFLSKRLYQTSLAWYLQAIGEAASRISNESRALIPNLPWKQIVGTRHILAHEYDRLLPGKLWRILRTHLPTLLKELERGIARLPAHSGDRT